MHNSTLTGNDQNYVYSHKGALDSFRKIEQKEPAHLHFHPKRSGLRGRVILDLRFTISLVKRSPGDYYPVSCSVKYGKSNKSKARVNKHIVIRYRNLKNFDEDLFLRDLKNQSFNLILQITDPDLPLDSWYDKFIYTLNKHAPLISKRVRKNKQPKSLSCTR